MIDLSIFLNVKTVIQILILWGAIYHIFLFLQGTRAAYLLWGVVYLAAAFFAFQKLDFLVLNWLMAKLFAFFLIIMAIIFQPEIFKRSDFFFSNIFNTVTRF